LPRYFADTGLVMDFESRLVHCMVSLQGLNRADVVRQPFSSEGQSATDLEALTAFVVEESRGAPIAVPQQHAQEIAAYKRGQKIFYFRGGPFDFSCASCHANDDQRIRLQDLPNLTQNPGAGNGFGAWPAYRVSNGQMWSMQLRLNDCYRQQRFPYPLFGSDVTIALGMYLGVNGKGGESVAPAIKR
jgi:sulfur-oxidizing protein SoxA